MNLNLGCGLDYRDGWVNLDCEGVRCDVRHDLRQFPWPFRTSTVNQVEMRGVLEHLPDTAETLREVWRILQPGGRFSGFVPYCGSHFAFRDPTHVRYFDEKVFDYWTQSVPWVSGHQALFRAERVELTTYRDKLTHRMRNAIPGRRLLRFFLWNMFDCIAFELSAIKE